MTLKDQEPSKKHKKLSIEADVMVLTNNKKQVVRPVLNALTHLKTGKVTYLAPTLGARYEH